VALSGCATISGYQTGYITRKPKKREESAFVNWMKYTFFYQGQQLLNPERVLRKLIGRPKQAINIDENGEVPDNSFYTNRDIAAMTLEEIRRGPCSGPGPVGEISITKLKETGVAPGFFGRDEAGVMYLFKFDPPGYPELATGAEIAGNRILYCLGYFVPEMYLLTVEGTGDERFDGKRAMASKFLEGELLGFFRYNNHIHRRELRALKIAQGWINNTDCKDANTLVAWRDGVAYNYLIDFNCSLGSAGHGPKDPASGWENIWDFEEFFTDLVTLDLDKEPYDKNAKPFSPAVGLFDANYDPRRWEPNYPNTAFEEITDEDARWMAEKISQFADEKIRAAVQAARYSRQEDEDYIVDILIKRRDIILRTYGVKE
jgi:hypothetical protein